MPKGHNQGMNIVSDVIDAAVEALNGKLSGGFDGLAKFAIEDEGDIIIDGDGARAGNDDADVTLSATAEVFQAILEGDINPTSAFMTGKLTVDGDMGLAMKLAAVMA